MAERAGTNIRYSMTWSIRSLNIILDNVYLLGYRSNPHKYVKQGDWFLSSSRYEGFSYISQEAAIIGKPLVLTDCAGVKELLGTEGEWYHYGELLCRYLLWYEGSSGSSLKREHVL